MDVSFELGRINVVQQNAFTDDEEWAMPDETYSIHWKNQVRTDRYERTTEEARLVFEYVSDGRLTVRRESIEKSSKPWLEYVQISDGPVS